MSVTLNEVKSKRDVREFHTFVRELYKNDVGFIPHIDRDIEAIFNPEKNTAFREGAAKRWLAKINGRVVGKIAAFYNEKLSGVGFFDCINDQRVANILFDVALDWLKSHQKKHVQAPVNFGERDKYWGLLVEGFNKPSSYQENYNFPYYQSLFENYGFTKAFEQTTSEVVVAEAELARIQRINSRLQKIEGLQIEHFKAVEKEKYIRAFVEIYNEAWKHHSFYTPFTYERAEELFSSMKPILREDLLWFTFIKDEPVAFYLSVIDVNQIFKHLNGSLNWFGKIKFAWYKKFGAIHRFRGLIFGVVPAYQNTGVFSGMIAKVYEMAMRDRHLKSTELAWIGDFNPRMHALFKALNAKKSKVHFTYEKQL